MRSRSPRKGTLRKALQGISAANVRIRPGIVSRDNTCRYATGCAIASLAAILAVLGAPCVVAAPPGAPLDAAPGSRFTDVTPAAGTGGPTEAGATGGHGVLFADADDDGLVDLYVTMIFEKPMADLFYRNVGGGRFAEKGAESGVADFDGGSHGACWADLDNDGDYDLLNGTTWPHPEHPSFNNIFRNDGGCSFTDVTPGTLRATRQLTRGVLCFDMDRDGDLDLFTVTNYQGSDDPPDERNEVYRNDGDFHFTPIDAGDLNRCPAGQGAIDTDFDGDGDIDVIAANRTGEVNLLRNGDDVQFTLVPPSSLGIRHRAEDGITTADIDGDGDLDLLLAGGSDRAALYRNDGSGAFQLAQTFESFDGYMGGFGDLDNDGDLDLVFAGDDRVYLNEGGSFTPGPAVPVRGINDPRAIAFADIENDGDLDFAVAAKRSRNWLIRNDYAGGNRWLKVALVSPRGQAGAFGAKVSVRTAGKQGDGRLLGFREARSNAGYLGQDDPVLHFGVGHHTEVNVTVVFLDGKRITHRGIRTCQTVVVRGRDRFLADRIGTRWRPFLEWRFDNPTSSGNAFDLVATAVFRHEESGETHATQLYWDGEGIWRCRFTGTRPGVWSFVTSSEDPDLDGRRGSVTITAHPDPAIHGFLTGFGNKWGWQGTDRAFVPQLIMVSGDPEWFGDRDAVARDIRTFFHQHGFNGCHVPTIGGRWFDRDRDDLVVDRTMVRPDPRTFEALEQLITQVHAAGGCVHIWAWGDQQRRQTPLNLRGGPDGEEARRLERYLAARLGPLPGWSMGYGFDLQEWAAVEGRVNLVRAWSERLQGLLGWPHFLGGRMGPTLIGRTTDHGVQARLNEGLGYAAYEHHRPTYETYVAALAASGPRPVMSEDRFRIRVPPRYPRKDYNEVLTRRGLYLSTMAGGVANIWGNNHPGGWRPGGGSRPYPHPEWIRTYATFFRDRFLKDMISARGDSGTVILRRPSGGPILFYAEDTDSLRLDLSTLASAESGVAVDACRPYEEIRVSALEPGIHTWKAPHPSDWAVAIGE